MSLLQELERVDEYPKIFWKAPNKKTATIAWGAKQEFFDFPNGNELTFGAMSFDQKHPWVDFPSCYFVEPKVIKSGLVEPKQITSLFTNRHDLPGYNLWAKNVETVKSNPVKKVVLARRTTFDFDGSIYEQIRHLLTCGQNAHVFAFILDPQKAFLGATPETLFRREDRSLFCEALAGTRPKELKEELNSSIKDQDEFSYVAKAIKQIISPLCYEMSIDTSIKETATLAHLHQTFFGKLKDGISDETLTHLLHPTPAIGGYPKASSLQVIREIEPFNRGWYSAPIGWVSRTFTNLVVGIRSAMMLKKKMHLFAGTGIVSRSDPKCEWEELEQKISLLWGTHENHKQNTFIY